MTTDTIYNERRRNRALLGLCPRCNKLCDRLPEFRTCSACAKARHQKHDKPAEKKELCLCGRFAIRYKNGWVCAGCDEKERRRKANEDRCGDGRGIQTYSVALRGFTL